MKPESWKTLPYSLLDTILWDIDSLDYDSYDSSKAEVIHDILNESISSINQRIVDAYWKAFSEDRFKSLVMNELLRAKYLVGQLEAYMENKA